ncbi:MAG: hypothetical protein ACOC3C_04145 [Candidatus Thorarchaeota archaeon]
MTNTKESDKLERINRCYKIYGNGRARLILQEAVKDRKFKEELKRVDKLVNI